MGRLAALKAEANGLKRQACAVCLAARHPRTPWYAKALAACVIAYAASPVDLIPDFIPVLGYLDDLVLVPAGVALVIRLVPRDVWDDCLARSAEPAMDRRTGWIAAIVITFLWLSLAAVIARTFFAHFRR
jgi:uncharacterized membrane protein YkvA (DUF1232 family)